MAIKKALIDLSGTLHIENTPLPGAIEALEKLRKENIEVRFVTNTTESRRFRYERLLKMGFNLDITEMCTSLWATRNVIVERKLTPMLLVDDIALEDLQDVLKGEPKDSVVVGLGIKHFNYDTLNKAFRLLMTGAPLIAVHEARYFSTLSGLNLGAGPFVKALEYAANCKAEVVGKPRAEFFQSALGDTPPSEAVMIGDDAQDDIQGAQAIGINGYLVQTGKYIDGDENSITPRPFSVVPDFAKAVELIIKHNKDIK